MRRLLFAALAVGAAAPAVAAPWVLSGRVDARAGYGSNPFLQPGYDRASAIVGFSINPTLLRTFATGSTSLQGVYSREQYFENQGHPDTLEVLLNHNQRLNTQLSAVLSASFLSSSNALANLGVYNQPIGAGLGGATTDTNGIGLGIGGGPVIGTNIIPLTTGFIDPLTIGARTRRYQGDLALNWTPTSRDTASISGGYAHGLANRRSGIGSYDFYIGAVSYSRSIGGRLRLGGRMGYTYQTSQTSETVSSYEPSVTLSYQFSEIWTFDGNIGATIRRVPSLDQTSTGLGFNATLCGTYPKTGICVSGSRLTSASGIGGARINTNFGISLRQQVTARDGLTVAVSYVNTKAVTGLRAPAQQFTQINSAWDHRIGQRLVVGLDGRYQTRSQDFVTNARALSLTGRIGYLFGRVS